MIYQAQQAIIDILGGTDYLETSGPEIRIDCPFCNHLGKKMYISKNGMYNCFTCDASGGSVLKFIMDYYRISYSQAKEYISNNNLELLNDYSVDANLSADSQINSLISSLHTVKNVGILNVEELSMPPLPVGTKKLIDNFNNKESFPFLRYLKSRGFKKYMFNRYDIRYCKRGNVTLKSGKPLFVNNSLVFISYKHGAPVYWNTRSIENNPYIKTFNASGEKNCYSKRNTIFNYDRIEHTSNVVICEGVFNVFTVEDTKIDNLVSVATFGKQITDEQLELIINKEPNSIFMYLDYDAYTIELSVIRRLVKLGFPINRIFLVPHLYKNKDANDIGVERCKKLLLKSIKLSEDRLKSLELSSSLMLKSI